MKEDFTRFVPVFEIEDWRDFEGFCRGCGPIVFRGQSDSSWDLTTNYEREFGTKEGINASRESAMLYRCLAEGKMFVENPPDRSDWVSWLAEMQHYGASTRLLDVTRSKYIALFFALVGMKDEKPGAVWAFDVAHSDNVFYDLLKARMRHVEIDRDAFRGDGILPYQDDGWKIANAAIGAEPIGKITLLSNELNRCCRILNEWYQKGMIVHLVPQITNRRLVAQQGEFLFPFNIRHTFVQNLLGSVVGMDYARELCEYGDAETRRQARTTVTPNILKAIIPYSLRDEFVDRLLEMNISYQTLFPDEFGFMKSLQYRRRSSRICLKIRNDKQKGQVVTVNEFDL